MADWWGLNAPHVASGGPLLIAFRIERRDGVERQRRAIPTRVHVEYGGCVARDDSPQRQPRGGNRSRPKTSGWKMRCAYGSESEQRLLEMDRLLSYALARRERRRPCYPVRKGSQSPTREG